MIHFISFLIMRFSYSFFFWASKRKRIKKENSPTALPQLKMGDFSLSTTKGKKEKGVTLSHAFFKISLAKDIPNYLTQG
ncbi:MAG: hypothetical protein IKN48_08195 [Bacteroidaceae bacterium]|nr:hypothetical protein [Bacteroidaceae bacterium]